MTRLIIQAGAVARLDDIYDHTARRWGIVQADAYLSGLAARFEAIAARTFPWRPLPAEFGLDGYVCRYERHLIYWKLLGDSTVGIVTILHERMHRIERLREAFAR